MRKSVALHRKSIIKESCFKTFKKFAKVFAFAISFESPLKALKLRKKGAQNSNYFTVLYCYLGAF